MMPMILLITQTETDPRLDRKHGELLTSERNLLSLSVCYSHQAAVLRKH
jgi:hypothetical protein